MNAESLRTFLRQTPFEPLEVHLSSGEVYDIQHPENAMVLKNTLVVGEPETDQVRFCSLFHITSVVRKGQTLGA